MVRRRLQYLLCKLNYDEEKLWPIAAFSSLHWGYTSISHLYATAKDIVEVLLINIFVVTMHGEINRRNSTDSTNSTLRLDVPYSSLLTSIALPNASVRWWMQ